MIFEIHGMPSSGNVHVFSAEEMQKHDTSMRFNLTRELENVSEALSKLADDKLQMEGAYQRKVASLQQEIERVHTVGKKYPEEFIKGFIGYLCGAIDELHHVEVPRVADVWEKWKVGAVGTVEAGKTASFTQSIASTQPIPIVPIWPQQPQKTKARSGREPEVESLWRQTCAAAIGLHGDVEAAVTAADTAVDRFRARFMGHTTHVHATSDEAFENIQQRDKVACAVGDSIRDTIRNQAKALGWSDPDCIEDKVIRKLLSGSFPFSLGVAAAAAYCKHLGIKF